MGFLSSYPQAYPGPVVPRGLPYFQFEVSNITGTPAAATGTAYTSGGSNADGSTVTVLSALAQDVQRLVIGVSGQNTSAEDNSALLDVLIDAAGGTPATAFIDDLLAGYSEAIGVGIPMPIWYEFPVFVKAGTSIGVRARKAGATGATGRVVIYAYGQPLGGNNTWWCGSGVETLGVTAASSSGVAITPGNTGTFSSYVTVGTSTKRYRAIALGVQGPSATANALAYHFELGLGSAAITGVSRIWRGTSGAEGGWRMGGGGVQWCSIPSGSVIQARATCSGTAQGMQVASYGVY